MSDAFCESCRDNPIAERELIDGARSSELSNPVLPDADGMSEPGVPPVMYPTRKSVAQDADWLSRNRVRGLRLKPASAENAAAELV